jgi:hypothetical protein
VHDAVSSGQSLELTADEMISGAVEIATAMFTVRGVGLEATRSDIPSTADSMIIPRVMEALAKARIGRYSGGPDRRFSFFHRRFNEFFLISKLRSNPELVNLESIPRDSRWRDALALYCEVIDANEGSRIINFCWSKIEVLKNGLLDLDDLAAVHCLRFLRDGFSGRRGALLPIRAQLDALVSVYLSKAEAEYHDSNEFDLVATKVMVDAIGILSPETIDLLVQSVFRLKNSWLTETAIRSCRYLPALSLPLQGNLCQFVLGIDSIDFIRRYREIRFSFSLSHAFKEVWSFCWWRHLDIYESFAGIIFAVLFVPIIFIMSFGVIFISVSVTKLALPVQRLFRRRFMKPKREERSSFALIQSYKTWRASGTIQTDGTG